MDDHDKILCERLATTVDHGICKCAERHHIAALEAELAYEKERSANNIMGSALELAAADDRYSRLAGWYGDECKRSKAAEAMLQAGRDVMAVIHGDGGHYREAHGDRKAADDAINIVIKLRADLAIERNRRDYEALEKDAARYRWLRGTQDEIVVGTSPGVIDHGISAIVPTYEQWLYGAAMDAAIDAEMSKG